MLNIMRQQARSWIIKVLLFAIVVVFIFWGVGSFNSRRDNSVAEINGEIITYDTYRQVHGQLRERYRRAYGDAFTDEMLKNLQLEEQALNQIVNRTMMLQEAKRLDIQVADQTIDEAILKIPAFQSNGVFDEERAKLLLAQNGMSTADFRHSFQQDLIIEKLQSMVVDGVVASEAETKEWYDWYNAEIDLNYMVFAADRYKDVSVSDEQITEYFKSHENEYRTEPQVKARYLFFDPDRFKDQVTVERERIGEYYDSHPDEFKSEKTIEARHILVKLDENADPPIVEEKKQQALKIYNLATAGKSFEELAKQYSEGPTREQGGYLGEFKKETMVQPFSDKAFSMKAGEISEPVRTRFGWHIIKVEKVNEARTRTLEEAAQGIQEKLVNEKARGLALQKAEEVYDATLFDGVNLADVGQTHQIPVQTTDFFKPEGPTTKDIGDPQKFAETAFGLEIKAVSAIQDDENGYYLLQVIDRNEASIPPLETVKDKVKSDLLESLRDERAKSEAEALLSQLQKGDSITEAEKRIDGQLMQTGFFKRTGAIPKIGYEPAISEAAFDLGAEKKLPDQVIKGQQGWYVIQLNARKSPEAEGFEKEKSSISERLTEQKKQSTLQQWLADLRARGQIKTNRELIK